MEYKSEMDVPVKQEDYAPVSGSPSPTMFVQCVGSLANTPARKRVRKPATRRLRDEETSFHANYGNSERRRMTSSPRLKSQLWFHFTAVDGEKKVKCLYCDQKLSVANKSTCSLIRHINKKHPTQLIIVKQAHSESKINNNSSNNIQADIQQTTAVSIANPVTHRNSSVPKSKRRKEFFYNKTNNKINTKKQKEIDRQVVRMITKEYHPFSIVEDKEFVKLINLLNPAYKLPTRKTLSHTLIPAIYKETVDKVNNRLDRAFAVCLTTDGWTSREGERFYAVTAHYIVENNDGMVLDSDLLGCVSFTERHTAEDIANKMKDIMTEWQIVDKVIVIVSDNAANMEAAVLCGGWRHWGCFAHSLNHITQAGIEEIEAVVDKIRTIISYFKRSSYAGAQLEATQENISQPSLKLKNDVPTRWNSTFDMIKRILSEKNAIDCTTAVLKSSLLAQNEEIQVDELTHDEWLIAEQAVQVLEVFESLTTVISSENKVTMSSIIIYLKQLKIHLRKFEMNEANLMPEINNMVARLLRELNSQFFSEHDDIEDNDLIGLSTILDPRYKKFGFIDETKYKKILEKLYSEVAQMKPTEICENAAPNKEIVSKQNMASCTSKADKLDDMLFKDFDSEVQKYLRPADATKSAVVEVDKYLQEPLLPRKDANGVNTDPLLWWFQRKHIYPRLNQLVKTRLNIIATSVPCDKIFSDAGQIVNEKRGNLKTSQISNVVFLNYNFNDTS